VIVHFLLSTNHALQVEELLEEIALDLSAYAFIIVNPGIHIDTAHAFQHITPALPKKSINDIIKQPIETWKHELKNDFEKPILNQQPEIAKIKDELYRKGAIYSSMSGSGSTVYGIFHQQQTPTLSFPANYFVKELISQL
jgi:4-diphosphocytidyl-2-C-methyl-D-erythritol kinase